LTIDEAGEFVGVVSGRAVTAHAVACGVGVLAVRAQVARGHPIALIVIGLLAGFAKALGVKGAKHARRTRGVADGVSLRGARPDGEDAGRTHRAAHLAIAGAHDPRGTGQSAAQYRAGQRPRVGRTKEV
jgi:hypothetical protein